MANRARREGLVVWSRDARVEGVDLLARRASWFPPEEGGLVAECIRYSRDPQQTRMYGRHVTPAEHFRANSKISDRRSRNEI